jgi:hypothetical protein
MKQVNITINVSDSKFDKLMEFLSKNFGNITVNQTEDFVVPEWHKEIVLQRIKNGKDENFFPLDDLDNKIKL